MNTKAPNATYAPQIEAAMLWLDAHDYLKKRREKRNQKFLWRLKVEKPCQRSGAMAHVLPFFRNSEPQRCSQPGQAFDLAELPLVA
jgi:hypothetical protein